MRRFLPALVLLIVLVAAVGLASLSERTSAPMNVNGDTVGMEHGESPSDYRDRVAGSLSGKEPRYALVSFSHPVTPAEFEDVVRPARRVGAVVFGNLPPLELRDPVAGEGRAHVVDQAKGDVDHALAAEQQRALPERITAAMVYDDGPTLRKLASDPRVFAVEALPADAAWGRIGVRPVQTSEPEVAHK